VQRGDYPELQLVKIPISTSSGNEVVIAKSKYASNIFIAPDESIVAFVEFYQLYITPYDGMHITIQQEKRETSYVLTKVVALSHRSRKHPLVCILAPGIPTSPSSAGICLWPSICHLGLQWARVGTLLDARLGGSPPQR